MTDISDPTPPATAEGGAEATIAASAATPAPIEPPLTVTESAASLVDESESEPATKEASTDAAGATPAAAAR